MISCRHWWPRYTTLFHLYHGGNNAWLCPSRFEKKNHLTY